MLSTILMLSLVLVAVFLILLVLIQRGKGGGLAGAFGGMGGQSAFGTKAGDTFTKITIGVSSLWIVLCLVTVVALSTTDDKFQSGGQTPPPAAGTLESDGEQPVGEDQTPAPAAEQSAAEQSEPGSEQ